MEPGLLCWKNFWILPCPKTYIWPLPNLDSLVPTARRDWMGSYARQLSARVSLTVCQHHHPPVQSEQPT